jgi:uncharacterized protein (DUF1800 family)
VVSVDAFIAVNRFGLGARPGDLLEINRDPRGWLAAQIDTASQIPDELQGLAHSSESLIRLFAARRKGPAAIQTEYKTTFKARQRDEIDARALAMIRSDQPFRERLVKFWSNHFTVSSARSFIGPIAGAYEREAIRPHIFGRFEDMLIAVVKHPAMLLYLDNVGSIGPKSNFGRASKRGLNENLAREVLELHTLGVGGGYSQSDVTEFARVLTGWSVEGKGKRGENTGKFLFVPQAHEPSAKTILGNQYRKGGQDEGERVLRDIARHRSTARFIATKLARHFVSDDPPKHVVAQLKKAFLDSDGDLAHLSRTLISLDSVWQNPLAKTKTPYEFIISTFRALKLEKSFGGGFMTSFVAVNHLPFSAPSPAGWPDMASHWISPEALMRRVEWMRALSARLPRGLKPSWVVDNTIAPIATDETLKAISAAPSGAEGLALTFLSAEFQRR